METKQIQATTGPARQVISEANPDPIVRAWVQEQWLRDYLHAKGLLWDLDQSPYHGHVWRTD
jgi:hypothetical protein